MKSTTTRSIVKLLLRRRIVQPLAAGALLLLGMHSAQAANDAWSTGPVDGTFTGNNWTVGATVGGPATGTILSGDSLYFDGSTITTLNENEAAGFSIGGFTFNSDASAYTIGGNAFALGGNVTNSSVNLQTINDAFSMAATQTFTTTAGGGNLLLGGVISGAGGLTAAGTGTLTLSGTNSYGGGTTVNGGTLSIAADANLGAAPAAATPASITLNGGTLQITGTTAFNTTTIAANRGITLGASGGTINIPTAATGTFATNEVATQYKGIISGTGGLTITGGSGTNSGTTPYLFQLGAANTYAGATTINNATVSFANPTATSNDLPATTVLTLANNGWYVFNGGAVNQTLTGLIGDNTTKVVETNGASANVLTVNPAAGQIDTFAGVIGGQTLLGRVGGSKISLVINGPGTEILTGANTYSNGTTVSAGTLTVSGAGTLGATTGALTVSNPNTGAGTNTVLNLSTTAATTTGSLSGTLGTPSSGTNTATINNGGQAFTVNQTAAGTYAGVIAGSGGFTLGSLSNNTLTLTGANTYTGTTTISAGTLALGGTTGTLATGSAIVDNGTFTINRSNAVTQGTDFSGAAITGTGGLTQAGAGTTTLNAANAYNGATTISGGTLALDFSRAGAPASNILPSGSALTLGTGTLNVNGSTAGGNSQTLGNLTLNGPSTVSVTSNGGATDALIFTGTLTRTAGSVDFVAPTGTSITLANAANQNKAFLGDYAFFGSGATETYAGTDISGNVIAATLTPTTGINGFNSATTDYAYTSPGSPDALTASRTADTGSFATASAQTIDLNGANTLTLNGFLNTGGALTIANSGTGGTLTVGSNNELIISGFAPINISVPIVNGAVAGALTDSDTGTLTLSGANTYTGGTNITTGTLALGSAGTLGNGAYAGAITNNAAFNDSSTANQTLSGVISGTGTLTQNGTGNLTISTVSTYTGATTINGGTLTLTATNTLSNTPTITVNNGGTLVLTAADTFGGSASAGKELLTINSGGQVLNNGTAVRDTLANPVTMVGGILGGSSAGDVNGAYSFKTATAVNATSDANGTAALINASKISLQQSTIFNVTHSGKAASDLTISSPIIGFGGTAFTLTKTGSGIMTLTGANTYGSTTVSAGLLVLLSAAANTTLGTGAVTVNGGGATNVAGAGEGVLQLAASNQIADNAPVTLNGGTLNTLGNNEGAADTGSGPTQGLGTLTLTNPNGTFSFLDYGTTNGPNSTPSTLAFADSSGTLGSGQVRVLNYEYGQAATGLASTTDHLYIGTTTTLSAPQLAQITFVSPTGLSGNYMAAQLGDGEIVPGTMIAPTPEPGGLVPIVIGIAGMGVLVARKRRAKKDQDGEALAQAV